MFKAVGLALSTAVLCEAIARQEPVEDVAPAEEVVDGEVAQEAPAEEVEDVEIVDEAAVPEEVAPVEAAAPEPVEEPTRVVHKSGGKCKPMCSWECDNPICNEICTPQCAAPTCKTYCKPVIKESCTVECGEPDCTVICPKNPNEQGKCQTVCKQPQCKTTCQQDCLSKCAEPLCTWNCHKPEGVDQCPKPKCKMACSTCNDEFSIPDPEVEPWQKEGAILQKVGQAKVGHAESLVHVDIEGGAFFQLPL